MIGNTSVSNGEIPATIMDYPLTVRPAPQFHLYRYTLGEVGYSRVGLQIDRGKKNRIMHKRAKFRILVSRS